MHLFNLAVGEKPVELLTDALAPSFTFSIRARYSLAHALGRVLLDLGAPAMARRLFAQARRALPKDALLQADIVRHSRATEDRP